MLGGDLSFLYSDATRFSRNPDDPNSDDYNVIGGRDNLESYRQEGMGAINEKLMFFFYLGFVCSDGRLYFRLCYDFGTDCILFSQSSNPFDVSDSLTPVEGFDIIQV